MEDDESETKNIKSRAWACSNSTTMSCFADDAIIYLCSCITPRTTIRGSARTAPTSWEPTDATLSQWVVTVRCSNCYSPFPDCCSEMSETVSKCVRLFFVFSGSLLKDRLRSTSNVWRTQRWAALCSAGVTTCCVYSPDWQPMMHHKPALGCNTVSLSFQETVGQVEIKALSQLYRWETFRCYPCYHSLC